MLAECGSCGTRFAPDLERCPQCGARKAEEMPKIIAGLGPSYPEGHGPGDGEEHVHPGFGMPMTGVEHPADGTMSPPVSDDGGGLRAELEEVREELEHVEAEVAPAPPAPPRLPPRRTPPPKVPDE